MNFAVLKKVRVTVSVLLFILTLFVFLDIYNFLEPAYTSAILYLQFVPSVIKFISAPAALGAGFIFIIIVSLLFGRVYCSSVCPVGTYQDVVSRLRKKNTVKKKFKYSVPHTLIRYGLLAATLVFIAAGSIWAVNILDPYSNFGRLITNLIRPLLLFVNNSAASWAEQKNITSIYRIEEKVLPLIGYIIPAVFVFTVTVMAFFGGRLYCNTICPVGTFLGLFSKFSFFKIAIEEESCKGCGICARACKAGCIDTKNKTVDFDRCVSCFNCLTVCPSDGVVYKAGSLKSRTVAKAGEPEASQSRRDFLRGGLVLGAGLTGLAFVSKDNSTQVRGGEGAKPGALDKQLNPVTPPGSRGREHFTDRCTACQLCVASCPTMVLQPSFTEYGILGMNQPRMDYSKSYCNFDCVKCGEVCPTGAILPLKPEEKQLTQIGIAKFIEDKCIVYKDGTDCGACSEHCPTKAVNMVPYKQGLFIPLVSEKQCIGCGACEHACPAAPLKAIYVTGSLKHARAEKAVQQQNGEKKSQPAEDFPF